MMNGFDPSKLDPKVLMELSQLVQQLPPEKLGRMQTLMHNMMAGFDVRAEMEEFERNLPAGFREKLMAVMASQGGMGAMGMGGFGGRAASQMGFGSGTPGQSSTITGLAQNSSSASASDDSGPQQDNSGDMDIREARMTILRAVAQGNVSPDDAERLLFAER